MAIVDFSSLKSHSLTIRPSLTSATLEEALGIFSKVTVLKSEPFNEKDEVCRSFLVEIFTKSLLIGGMYDLLHLRRKYTIYSSITIFVNILTEKICKRLPKKLALGQIYNTKMQ